MQGSGSVPARSGCYPQILDLNYSAFQSSIAGNVQPAGWTKEIHQQAGKVVLGDGTAQQVNSAALQELLRNS